MAEITRDLNQKEGINLPNPYLITLPTITKIINENRNLDLLQDQLDFSNIKTAQQEEATQLEPQVQAPPLRTPMPMAPQPTTNTVDTS